MRRPVPALAFALATAALLAVPARAEDAIVADVAHEAWGAPAMLVRRFSADREELRAAYAVPLSREWPDREDRFLAEWEARVRGFAADNGQAWPTLAISDRVDHALLAEEVRHRRAELAFDRSRLDETLKLLPFAPDLGALEQARRRLANAPPRECATRLEAARKSLADVRAAVEKDAAAAGATAVVAARAARELDALRGAMRTWFQDRDGYEPEFGWWCRKPWHDLDAEMEQYAVHLRDKVAGGADAMVGDPIGEAALAADLAHEFVPYSPKELLAIADREMAWCEAEARKCAKEMGLGDDWKAALAKVKSNAVAPGEQDELVAAQAREAVDFVTSRDLVTVPELCREVWRLHMIPADTQKTMPYAYYSGQAMGVAFPTDAMEHDRKLQAMRGNNVHFSRIVTPHELIPGHHLQMFVAERHRSYRGVFRTPFLVEGWALWWEMRLWELGWAKSPEDRLGMLFWRMHRCARISVSLRFHLGEMKPAEMIDFLVDRVGHERDGATAEVRRYVGGGYGPLYQAAYMLGGLQLRALHRELVGSGKVKERDFHDAVLREGPIPVRMIRAALTNEAFDAAGPGPWRFAE